jgi:putative ABC transport system ATP-binding protein
MTALLELKAVDKRFVSAAESLHILSGVSFAVGEGETVAVTGPSGSGKSTLLGLMAGLERPSSGQILFEGADLGSWDEDRLAAWRRKEVGFIFQSFRLISSLTALENVALPLEILGRPSPEAADSARRLLKELGLEERGEHFPHQLSGGEQQRVAIARAYAHEPRIIFADEPTGSLDRETAAKVLSTLLETNARRRTALIIVTHDAGAASQMQRRLALEAGRILA